MIRTSLTIATALLCLSARASVSEPLVDATWLKANIGRSDMRLLDVRSGAGVTKEHYLAGHIPGAVFTDYARDGWRERNSDGVEGMLPQPAKLEALIGGLGVGNNTHVVLIPEGRTAADVGTATRLYWTLKIMGHDQVSILDGGFAGWLDTLDAAGKPANPIERGEAKFAAQTFKAEVRTHMLIDRADVEAALKQKVPLIDNRPHDFFVGLVRSGAAKMSGTLPGARSLPEGWMTINGGGKFRSRAELARLYEIAKIPTSGRQVTFCNTGHWASLGWFVGHELLGNREVRMYDGSMADWTRDRSLPVEQHIKLE